MEYFSFFKVVLSKKLWKLLLAIYLNLAIILNAVFFCFSFFYKPGLEILPIYLTLMYKHF